MAEVVSVEPIHEGWSRFSLVGVRLSDGQVIKRYVEDHGNAVAVLPYDPERRVALLVRQLRAPVLLKGGPDFEEPPAGLIEDGEDPADTGRREVEEETGFKLGVMQPLGRYWSSPGVSAETTDLYLAAYSSAGRVGSGGGVDDHEDVETVEVPLADLAERAAEGELQDLKLYAMVQALMRLHPELFA